MAQAIDLTVSSIEVIQAVQYGTTKLFGKNLTWVRVKVGTSTATSNVDAALRMYVNGVEVPGGPIFSLNGPITAPVSPNSANINDTINFAVLPPISNNVDFTVEVNPNRNVVETNYANNTLSANDKNFECRKVLEVASVSINYTPGGGQPPANMIEPGIGDGFLRAIYHPGEWNFHLAPLPPLNWTTPINSSNTALLNTLHDIRINQIPAAGFAIPDFVFGWLPGNPYSGNGQAIGIPGDVAFGNTDTTRFQRTFAHEMGHLFGLSHINQLINTNGIDTERHLKDTQNLAQIFPSSKNDVMVAGLLTSQAFVWQNSYNSVHNDSRMTCVAADDEPAMVPVLRLSGLITVANKSIELDPVTRIARAHPTNSDPFGDLVIASIAANGEELAQITVRSVTNPEMCSKYINGKPTMNPHASLNVSLPETINGLAIQQIKVTDRVSGRLLASRARSANAPIVAVPAITVIEPQQQGVAKPSSTLLGRLHVAWSAQDADGDSLTHNLLYSPDQGASWLPLSLNSQDTSFEFSTSDIPTSNGSQAVFKVVTTDGMNVLEVETPAYALGSGNPPATYLLTPNSGDTFPQKAPVAFHATSWDLEDKVLTDGSIAWTSSIDGPIGTGQLFINSNLSPGTHTINVTGTDSSAMSSSKEITVTITPRIVISPDCNGNGVLDLIDIANGTSTDGNGNGIPDSCENSCVADINHSTQVDIDDLLAVVNAWGPCADPNNCPADIAPAGGNDGVDIDDLLAVINTWGACP